MIIEEKVSVLVSGSITAALRAGDCFGEMAYVARRPRAASNRSATDVAVLKISNELLEKTSVFCQLKFIKMFLSTLIGRLSSTRGK